MSREVKKFTFYVIALYGKKDMPFAGDKKGRFVGYFHKPHFCSSIRRMAFTHYATRSEAKGACRILNADKDNWFYGKVQKYSATLEGK